MSEEWGGRGPRGGRRRDQSDGLRRQREADDERRAPRPGRRAQGPAVTGHEQGRHVPSSHLGRDEIPELPVEASIDDFDKPTQKALLSLGERYGEQVARHLSAAGRLMESDPELAYRHARTAADRAGRIDIVREAAGIAAYLTGRYAEAGRELRAYRRLAGVEEHLPILADIERGLGRPEKAIELAHSEEGRRLRGAEAVELTIVVAGARGDLGEFAAAKAMLGRASRVVRDPELKARLDEAAARIDVLAAGGDPDAEVPEAASDTTGAGGRAVGAAVAAEASAYVMLYDA
jgi:hypothetical protein